MKPNCPGYVFDAFPILSIACKGEITEPSCGTHVEFCTAMMLCASTWTANFGLVILPTHAHLSAKMVPVCSVEFFPVTEAINHFFFVRASPACVLGGSLAAGFHGALFFAQRASVGSTSHLKELGSTALAAAMTVTCKTDFVR